MTLVRCEFHGLCGFLLVCKHLPEFVEKRENIVDVVKVILTSDSSVDPFEAMDCDLFYCKQCAIQYNFPTEDTELSDSYYEHFVEKEFNGVCVECFKELSRIDKVV